MIQSSKNGDMARQVKKQINSSNWYEYIHSYVQNFVIRLKGPLSSSLDPVCGLRGQPIPCTIEPRQTTKRKRPHLKSCACLDHSWCKMQAVCHTLEHNWERRLLMQLSGYTWKRKGGDSQALRAVVKTDDDGRQLQKGESQAQRTAVQPMTSTGWNLKKANCSTLLKRITRLKCVNSEVKSNVSTT